MTAVSEETPIRIGILGLGSRMATILSLVARHAPNAVVTALYDPDAEAAARARQQLAPSAAICAAAEEVCGREDVDWVFIGSWNCFHAEQAIAAFKAGKNVFCEKPLALSLSDAEAMHAAWRASGREFFFGLVLRYSPLYRLTRSLISKGSIGKLISFEFNETLDFNHGGYIHGNWRRFRRNAGSHLLEKCCHDLDLALWFCGDAPRRVASFGGRTFFTPGNAVQAQRLGDSPEGKRAYRAWPDPCGVDPFTSEKDIVDHQVALIEFQGGVRATFHTNCNAGIPERRFYLLGSEGTLRVDGSSGVIELRRIGWTERTVIYNSQPVSGINHGGCDDVMAMDLARRLRGEDSSGAGFAEGLRSLVLAKAIDEACEEGSVVDLSSDWRRIETLD